MDVKSQTQSSIIKSNLYSYIYHHTTEYLLMIVIAVSMVGITSGSHSIGFPLYKLNPMHWVVYFTVLLRKPSFGTIVILAFALPFTSNLLTGHPLLIKSVIVFIELMIYGMIFFSLNKIFNMNPMLSYLISQIAGHTVYYGLKFTIIQFGLIESDLVSTSVILQVLTFGFLGTALYYTDKYLKT